MADRPNVVLITTDQQRFDTISAAGNPHIRTPNLNWLADNGIRFSNAYTDCPICVAARATIMMGKHGHTMGLVSNAGKLVIDAETSLPGILTHAGYQTRAQGKMHFAPRRCNHGFEHMEILEDYYRYMAAHPEKGVPMDHGLGQNVMEPGISTVDETNSLTHWTVDRSVDFLETRDDTRPFFLWTSFAKPHPPLDPCRSYWEMYRDRTMPTPVRGDWSATIGDIPPGFLASSCCLNMCHRFDEELMTDIRRAYYACITQIDYNLGILFSRLRELGLLDNTWIIFTSDHGEMLGDHHMGAKSVGLEGAAHVPMLVKAPGGHGAFDDPRRGMVSDALVCLADVLPTVLAATGVELPGDAAIDGMDMVAAAAGGPRREVLHGECKGYHFVRQGAFKYCYEELGGGELMFDLARDPKEEHDLIRAGEQEDVRQRLRGMLVERLTAAGSDVVKDGDLVCENPDLTLEDLPKNTWPGYHTRKVPADVLH